MLRATARTESSIALSSAPQQWLLLNASPDVLHQVARWPAAHPNGAPRATSIRAILLVDSQIDHCAGLLMLREGARLSLYSTRAVFEDLTSHFPAVPILQNYCGVDWTEVVPGNEFALLELPDVRLCAIAVAGKAPPYSPARESLREGDNIGLVATDNISGRSICYIPGIAAFDSTVRQAIAKADCVMIDGTFWSNNEMIALGVGRKHAHEMGHLPLSGKGGILAELRNCSSSRKILVHINNTNPILDEDSPERRALEDASIEVASDGMEFDL